MHRYVYRYEGHPDLFAKMRQLVKEERAQNLTGDLTNYCFEKKVAPLFLSELIKFLRGATETMKNWRPFKAFYTTMSNI